VEVSVIKSRASSCVVLCCVLGIGCAGAAPDQDEETLGVADQALLWSNGDSPSAFWEASTQTALRSLAKSGLVNANGQLVETSLTASASGRTVLGYVIGCALPAGSSLYSPDAGASFTGWVGLTPGWASSALNQVADQRWMTACLLQTLNGLGVHVPIRLAGSAAVLADPPGTNASSFTVPDDTAFGNVFVTGGGAYVCTDIGVDLCDVQVSLYSLERICGLSPTCGVSLLGPCSLYCAPGSTGATCVGPDGNTYTEAISTTLQTTVSLSLFPGCSGGDEGP
jgi:hypothetical protein